MNIEDVNVSELSENKGIEATIEEVFEIKDRLLSKPFLASKAIGLSSSESDNLESIGLSELHLQDLVIEINRYLLASGASMVYGGDLRIGGITEVLISLVSSYNFPDQENKDRLRSYLAFPISLNLTKETEAEYVDRIKFCKVEPPEDLYIPDRSKFVPPVGASNLYLWARSLTKMRQEMEESCDARVFIGGRATGFKGRAPGVLEEILVSLHKETPLFLIGGFGGVVESVVAHLNGESHLQEVLNEISQLKDFIELSHEYVTNGLGSVMDWPSELVKLLEPGWVILSERNGLSVDDNKRLAKSTHVVEIVYYILKGLAVICKRK
jgi:hypothetical protein